MAKVAFSKPVSNFGKRMAKRVDDAGGEPFGFDIIGIATIALSIWAQVKQAFAACKVQPPAPPPIPEPLADSGITEETWTEANGAKFAAEQCKGKVEGFSGVSIRRAASEIAKAKGIKKKAAKPMAIAALQTARDESVETLATAMQAAKDNSADLTE